MLGSAIPKRWVVSLALVGLVSLFMASYAAVWSGEASAAGSTVPDAPISVAAVAGDEQVTVSWTAPGDDGGAAITQYSVVGTPSTSTVTTNGSTLTAVIPGLTNGTAYTFAVTALNSEGSSTSSAASNSVTPVDVPTGGVLSDLLAPNSLNLSSGQVVVLSALPIDDLGNQDLSLPNVTYSWNTSSGCGSMTSGSTSRTPTFTADSGSCSGEIIVHANQGDGANVPASGRTISVSISAPPAAPAPTAVPVDPVVIPVIIPSGLNASDVDVILPVTGGMASSVTQTIGGVIFRPTTLNVPSGALDSGTVNAVDIVPLDVGDVPAPPPPAATEGSSSDTFMFGSSIIEVQWYDGDGAALDTFRLNRPAQICVPFTAADLAAASGGPDGLAIWRYNGTEWVPLASSVDTFSNTVCANTSNFSVFALGLAVAAPETEGPAPEPTAVPETGLPVTGDYTPGMGALVLAMLAGIALIATGAFTARRVRRVRTRS